MNRLKQRLTVLYTATTGGILLIVILLFFLSSIHKTQNAQLEQFHLIWNSLSSRFLSDNAFCHGFLAQTEADYHLVIHIRENGHAFLYPGAWTPPDSREWLIAQARELAENEGVFMDRARFLPRSAPLPCWPSQELTEKTTMPWFFPFPQSTG